MILCSSTIERVDFGKTPSLGEAPVFWVRFHKDRKSEFEGTRYTKLEGSFEGDMSPQLFESLCEILSSAELENLNGKYNSGGTCQSTESLKVFLRDGSVICIEDYGNAGPAKLKKAKEQLKLLMYKVSWEEIEPRNRPPEQELETKKRRNKCHCGSGKRFENCHGFIR